MKRTLLVRGARQLLTLRGPSGPRRGSALRDLGIIADGALLIVEGVIAEVGVSRRVENLAAAKGAAEIDATGRVVMPGFVDSHTHLVAGPPRLLEYEMRAAGLSDQEIAAAGGGPSAMLRAVRGSSARSLELRARDAVIQFIRHGTTTLEAKSGAALDGPGELKLLKVMGRLDGAPIDVLPTCFAAGALPPEYSDSVNEYVDWMCAWLLPKIRERRLARFADVSCEPDAFGVEQSRHYLESARGLGMIPKVHAGQHELSGGVRLAVEIQAASADGLAHVSRADTALLAGSSTMATLLPAAAFHSQSDRYPPARELIDQGAAVALATDYNHLSATFNMQMVVSLACVQMRMTPAEAVSAATINGAHALLRASRIGSLEYRKDADLIVLGVSDYREIPYWAGGNLVALTMKRGRVLYREAEVAGDSME